MKLFVKLPLENDTVVFVNPLRVAYVEKGKGPFSLAVFDGVANGVHSKRIAMEAEDLVALLESGGEPPERVEAEIEPEPSPKAPKAPKAGAKTPEPAPLAV